MIETWIKGHTERHMDTDWRRSMTGDGQPYHMPPATIPLWVIFMAACLAAFIIVVGLLLLARGSFPGV